jgi:hypothetical protein
VTCLSHGYPFYVIRQGWVWQIDTAPNDYIPQSDDEAKVLDLLTPEHHN